VDPGLSARVLRPSLRRRVPFLVLALVLLVMSVWAVFFAPLIGAAGVLLFGFGAVVGAIRLVHPRSYATELDPQGFRTFDTLGRPVHDVRWQDVEHLTVFHGNGFTGPGTVLHLARRCRPRQPGSGRQPWVRGGVNRVGEEYDGALPDPYLGIEPMLELFKRYADAAPREQAAAPARLEPF
jgi:hypothetical protein